MKTIQSVALILLFTSLVASHVMAKRGAPKDVAPITRNGVIYSVPHDQMGSIVAKDEKSEKVLWTKLIYTVKYVPGLEKDVQDCFITELKLAEDKLIVTNENNDQYELDPATQAVKVLKGAAVVDRTAEKGR